MDASLSISATEHAAVLARLQAGRANRAERLEQMHQRQAQGLKIARQAAQLLKQEFQVTRVVLFGSLLQVEQMHDRSDIDLAVWGLPSALLIKAGCAVDKLSLPQGLGEIDLVRFESAYPYIQAAIQKNGQDLMTDEELFAQIHNELDRMQATLATSQRFLRLCESSQPGSDPYDAAIGSLALNLQSFYSGAERLLSTVAKAIDSLLPQGREWHKNLLAQMSIPLTGQRPALLSAETLRQLDELRRFRHLVRNAYSDDLDAERVIEQAQQMASCYTNLHRDCCTFQQALSQAEE